MVGLKPSGKSPMSACRNAGGSSKSVLMSLMLAAITVCCVRPRQAGHWDEPSGSDGVENSLCLATQSTTLSA